MLILCILGRQPALSLAELESRLGSQKILLKNGNLVTIETDDIPDFNTFGSVLKAVKITHETAAKPWEQTLNELKKTVNQLKFESGKKVHLGLSVYGFGVSPSQVNSSALTIKSAIKKQGFNVRIIPNKTAELNSAQVMHNRLIQKGYELVVARIGDKVFYGHSIWSQNIDSYRDRDQLRPKRDARVGMLPPKLAQIILNLACPTPGTTILDPFCGTGVLLQEALLAGHPVYGTDIDKRMIDYSQTNLEWLKDSAAIQLSANNNQNLPKFNLEVGDAATHKWLASEFKTVAGEAFLGRPFSANFRPTDLEQTRQDVNSLLIKFLKNLANQTAPGFRLCIAVPAWFVNNQYKHLPLLDQQENLGYNRVSFVQVNNSDLIYRREDQVVARELLVLTRI